jgi:AraC-like DNA-binding protein
MSITGNSTTKQFDKDIKLLLEGLFRESKPYLQHGYSLRQLSASLHIPLYQVSAFINREYAMRFTDLVNLHRIGHAIVLIRQGQAFNWSLDGLALQCGFNNRNSFRDAFKRFTGYTPSLYMKRKHTAMLLHVYRQAV